MTPTVTNATASLRRRRGLTEGAAAAAIDQACLRLRLPTVRGVLEDATKNAEREQLSYLGYLAELLLAEVDDRDRRSTLRRVVNAGFSRQKWLQDFGYDANINPATIHTLVAGDWIRRGEPLCLIGDSGTGKSHLLICLGTAAAEQGFRVRYTLATRLVNELAEAADEKQLARTIARCGRVDLLIIDELGYMELDRHGAELFSRSSPSARRKPPSRSEATRRSPAGRRPSPTRSCVPRWWTVSPSTAPSSKPARTPTGSTTPALKSAPSEYARGPLCLFGRLASLR